MKFCRFCGTKLPTRSSPKYCPKCGKNIGAKPTSQSRPPIREIKQKLIHQPQPLARKTSNYRPQVDNRPGIKTKKVNKIKKVKISKLDSEFEPKLSSQQAQIVYNQKLSSIISRITETNNTLAKRDSFQLADHHTIMLQIEELNDLKNNPFFDRSEMKNIVRQTSLDSSEVILRISEYLTSHLSASDLDHIRDNWYKIKEEQAHWELDVERIQLLLDDADKLEKNFNLLAYKLESATKNSVPRSVIFASYPQVYHYYFKEVKKITPGYHKKIEESGFYRYYKNEKILLMRIQSFFESTDRNEFAPFELYSTIVNYLETKNNVSKKINIEMNNIKRKLNEGYQQFKIIRDEYIKIMSKKLDETPIDILLMREDNNDNIITQQEIIIQNNISSLHELVKKDNFDLGELNDLKSLKEINNLNNINKLSDIQDLAKLSKISE